MARRRQHFSIARRFAEPERFVFLDESGASTDMTRLYGRSPVGQRCVDTTPQGHWQTTTMLSAIRADRVVPDATVVIDGAMNGPTFLDYTKHWLAPTLSYGDIVVMDNLASHKVAGVREAIEAAGAELWLLPPYSPDLNPIEQLWSKVKAWLRRVAATTFSGLVEAIADALRDVDVHECRNYLTACGYVDC